jgi:hypothetical protein
LIGTRRLGLLWVLAALAPAAHADEATSPAKKPTPAAATPAAAPSKSAPAAATVADDEFLEFLGSVDTESGEKDWMDYLAETDVSKVAKAKKTGPSATEVRK